MNQTTVTIHLVECSVDLPTPSIFVYKEYYLNRLAEKGKRGMDPVTTAIVAALAAGATSGVTEAGKKAVADAYEALKALLKKKFGNESEMVKSVESLETKPDSTARKGLLQEEVTTAKADQDPDILQAAQALLDEISIQPGGVQHIQSATGSYIAQADRGSTASVNINQPRG